MTVSKKTTLALTLMGVLAVAMSANAQEKFRPDCGFRGAPHEMRGINLTEAQQLKILELRKEIFKDDEKLMNDRRQAVENLIKSDNFDESIAKKLIEEREEFRKTNELKHLKFKHGVNKILTPEQRQLRDEYQNQKMSQGQFRHHSFKGMGSDTMMPMHGKKMRAHENHRNY